MITFQQIRNATIKLYYPGVTFMIDPWLMNICDSVERDRAVASHSFIPKPICSLPASAEELTSDVDYYLLTHFHPDHFSTDYLPVDATFICQNDADARQLKELGYTNLRWFHEETMQISGVTIYRTDARHGENKDTVMRMGPGSGFVFICGGEKIVYLAGDTVYYDGVRAVINRFQPDVMIVNACDARIKTGRLIMNVDDVKKACDCRPDTSVIASHMDAVSHAHLTREQLRKELADTRYAEQVLIPGDGERIEII